MAIRPKLKTARSGKRRQIAARRRLPFVAAIAAALLACAAVAAAEAPARPDGPAYATETVRGKVVWLADALKRRYGVATEAAAAETSTVLEMADGTLLPIVPDTRGHAFAVDERLRGIELELLVRKYEKVPLIQVIRVLRPTDDGLVEIDYWCDVCAIPMYILKPCECCQGETRLRERPVAEVFQP